MTTKIFIDTTAWISFTLKGERQHERAVVLMKQAIRSHSTLLTSNDIVDETVTRLLYSSGFGIAKKFYTLLHENIKKRLVTQLWTDEVTQADAWCLLAKFREHKLSLTDATSIALMKRFHFDSIMTFDSDFRNVGISTYQLED